MKGTEFFQLLSAFGGLTGVAAIISVLINRNKINAEANRIGVDAETMVSGQALRMYELARKEATDAKREVEDIKQRLTALEAYTRRLETMLTKLGVDVPSFNYPTHL